MMIRQGFNELREQGRKSLAVLIDPDKIDDANTLNKLLHLAEHSKVDFLFIGGSLLVTDKLRQVAKEIKAQTKIPLIIFPGSNMHIIPEADAILFLSLISGRNPELLIGQHVVAAPILKQSNLEILSTGYMLVGDSARTTVSYISHTLPIPTSKPEIAASTALAGEMLGMGLIYLDAGSGAEREVPVAMIEAVKDSISIPLIVGGGIDHAKKAEAAFLAGADVLVLGTALEKDPKFISEVADIRSRFGS
jgi:phosphoglycerol geranylgeranyltransferase